MAPRAAAAGTALLVALIAPSLPGPAAAPRDAGPRPDPNRLASQPSYIQRVAPAIVGIHVDIPRDRPSVAILGSERWGSGVIFDGAAGYALTVSYVLLDADRIEATLRDGRRVPAKLVGLDLEVGVGVIKLQGIGPWPAADFGHSAKVAAGDIAGIVGMSEDGALVATAGRVEAVQPFTAAWEYRLDRAFVVSPYNPAFGGGALVDAAGLLIGITSLRLGDTPYVNLAIPIEAFLPGKDELCDKGRILSRRPRPWLGLYTASREGGGVVVAGLASAGPARAAGVRRGDVIVRLNGEKIGDQEHFYTRLWQAKVDEEIQLVVQRDSRFEAISVRPADRYRVYRTSDK